MNLSTLSKHALACATVFLAFAAPAWSHEGHHHTALGLVRTIDATHVELETKEGKLESFELTATTKFRRGEADASREELTVGTRAVVMYETKDGKKLAIEVRWSIAGSSSGRNGSGRNGR